MSGARTLAAVLLIAAVGLGCTDEPARGARCGDHACPADCTSLAGPSCDILVPACRERVLAAVVCARDTPGSLPEVRVLTSDELRAEWLDAGKEDAGALEDEDAGSDPEADGGGLDAGVWHVPIRDPWSAALRLLGLLPAGSDTHSAAIDDQSKTLAGYYDASEQRITLVDDGKPQNDWDSVATLAHELVHRLQDQALGLRELGERGPQSWDGRFANGSLIEGDATLYGALALALLQGKPFDSASFAAQQRGSLKYGRREVISSPAPYSALWHLHYPIGTSYLFDAFREGGNWGVQRIFESPPTSTIHLMVGYEENLARREHLVLPLACGAAATPAGYTLFSESSLGASLLFAFLGHALVGDDRVLESEAQWDNALRWREDRLSIFEDVHGQVALSYRIRFADGASAIADALRSNTRVPLKVVQHDRELELLSADDATVLDGWETDPASCPLPPP